MSNGPIAPIVLYIGLCVLFSIICFEIKRFFKIPISTSLLVLGFTLREVGPYLGQVNDVIDQVTHLDPHIVSFAFLPILIFCSSFSIDWYTFKKEIWQIFSLGTTLVIGCSLLTALALMYIFQYDYSFSDLFLLGVLLSATDHIAVDALLKEIVVSDELETLIGGETLCNDATVLVLFEVLVNRYTGVEGIKQSIILFLRLSFGGFAMGIAFAIAMSFILKRTLNDFFIETNIMLIAAYLLFWICEYKTVHFSGALGLVSYGLFMSAYGKTLISPGMEERIKEVFELLSRNIEAIIFISAGLLFANITINDNSHLETKDYWVLFLLFPVTYVIRFIVVFAHYPILRYFGYGLTWKELVVLCMTGMKGVIAVALSLIASHEDKYDDHFKAIVTYFAIGISALSIIIGGPAIRAAVKFLGLEELTEVQENMLVGVTSALVEIVETKIETLRNSKDSQLVDWERVKNSVGTDLLIKNIIRKTKNGKALLRKNAVMDSENLLKVYKKKMTVKNEDMVIETRRRYLATVKGLYWERFEEGQCHGEAALMLMDSASMSIDKETEKMNDWKYAESLIYDERIIRWYKKLSKIRLIGTHFRKLLYKKIILAYDSANNFIICHEESEKLIDEMEIDVDKETFKSVMKEAHKQIKECEKFMKLHIIDCYPEVLAEVQTKRCSKMLLYTQRELISEIYEDGLIKEVEHDNLISAIDSSIKAVTFKGIPSIPVIEDILTYRFTAASSQEIKILISKIKEFEFVPGHVFFNEGTEANGAFLIIRGRVKEHSSWIKQELIIGNIVGVQHLLEEFSLKYTSTAVAITSGIAAHIPREILSLEGFVEEMYTEAAEELILLNRKRYDLVDINEKYILRVIEKSKVRSFPAGKFVSFRNGALVMKGKVFEEEQRWVIPPTDKKLLLAENCILLKLPKDFKLSYYEDKTLGKSFEIFCGNNENYKNDLEVSDYGEDADSRLGESSIFASNEFTSHKIKSKS